MLDTLDTASRSQLRELHQEDTLMSVHLRLLLLALFAGSLTLLTPLAATATVHVELQRLSDTDALLVATGSLSAPAPAGNPHIIFLSDPFSVRPAPSVDDNILVTSDLHAGSYVFNFAHDLGTNFGPFFQNIIYVARDDFVPIPLNEPFTGSMLLHLADGATLAPLGASGDVFWGSSPSLVAGTWEVVPEPAIHFLLLAGAISAALVLRRVSTTEVRSSRLG